MPLNCKKLRQETGLSWLLRAQRWGASPLQMSTSAPRCFRWWNLSRLKLPSELSGALIFSSFWYAWFFVKLQALCSCPVFSIRLVAAKWSLYSCRVANSCLDRGSYSFLSWRDGYIIRLKFWFFLFFVLYMILEPNNPTMFIQSSFSLGRLY